MLPDSKSEGRRDLAAKRAAIARARLRDDGPGEADARREYAAAKLAEYIRTTVAAAPALTDEQRDQLIRLLRPNLSSAGGSDAA